MDKELLKPVSDKVCILYNQHGAIVHTHRVVSLRGGRIVTDEEVERHARARARAAGHDITTLSALEVAGEQYQSSSIYQVDVVNKKLVKISEFIPIKASAAKGSDAPGRYAEHSRVPSPDRGHPPSTDGAGL